MKPRIENMCIVTIYESEFEIRVDWSNDRHHVVVVRHPHGKEEVIDALLQMAVLVGKDQNLD